MTDFHSVRNGPWRVRITGIGEGKATVSYDADGKWDTIAVESHEDLALLRDAITEYLQAVEAAR